MDISMGWAIVILLAVLGVYSYYLLQDDSQQAKDNYFVSEEELWCAQWPAIARLPENYRIRIRNAVNVARYVAEAEMRAQGTPKELPDGEYVSTMPRHSHL